MTVMNSITHQSKGTLAKYKITVFNGYPMWE